MLDLPHSQNDPGPDMKHVSALQQLFSPLQDLHNYYLATPNDATCINQSFSNEGTTERCNIDPDDAGDIISDVYSFISDLYPDVDRQDILDYIRATVSSRVVYENLMNNLEARVSAIVLDVHNALRTHKRPSFGPSGTPNQSSGDKNEKFHKFVVYRFQLPR